MPIKTRKIAVVGAGQVGNSFLYSAMNKNLADEYGIIDLNFEYALGNKMDFEDAIATISLPFKVHTYQYEDLKDVDVLVITAGRPQKKGETRIEMVFDNAKIMRKIAKSVKLSGFEGITLLASNPVDIMTQVFQEVSQLPAHKVIGSGTALDSARLRFAISELINVAPQAISAYVIGEHGDTSVSAFSAISVSGKSFEYFLKKYNISQSQLATIHQNIFKKAYEIINRKGATFYGIGSALSNLAEAVLRNTNQVYACDVFLKDEFGKDNAGIYIGVPAIINKDGVQEVLPLDLSQTEQKQFAKSVLALKQIHRQLNVKN